MLKPYHVKKVLGPCEKKKETNRKPILLISCHSVVPVELFVKLLNFLSVRYFY